VACFGPWTADHPSYFDQPQAAQANQSDVNEAESARTQEFVLRWRSEADPGFREIVRQQWNFSPPQTTREIEDYQVDLARVKVLELVIVPDIDGGKHVRVARKPAVGLVHAADCRGENNQKI